MLKIQEQPIKIISNTIPSTMIGAPFNTGFGVRFNNAPPIKNNTYYSLVELSLFIIDANTGKDLYVFIAEKQYSFLATNITQEEAIEIIYNSYIRTINEFDLILKESKNTILFTKKFQPEPRETIIHNIKGSLVFNSQN